MQAMTFPVKQVFSAKSTLKLNTDQNLMSSICESNIVITKSQLVSMLLMSCSLLGSTAMVSTKTTLGWFGCSIRHFSNRFDETLLWLGRVISRIPRLLLIVNMVKGTIIARFCFNSWCKTRCFRFIMIRWIIIFSSTSSWNGEDCIRDICIHFQAIFGNEKNNQDEKMYFVAKREKRQSLGGGVQIIFPSL